MPNRYVRESAIESERVNALSWQAEVFFRRLINRVDDFGRYTANFALLRASLFPLQLDKVTEADIKRLLAEVESCGLLATYEAEGKRFLVLARWEQGRAKESRHPSPPAEVCERLQTYVYKPGQVFANAPDSDSDTDPDIDSDKRASASGNLLLVPEETSASKKNSEAKAVLRALNEIAGRSYRETQTNLDFIRARLSEKDVTVDGCIEMIRRQTAKWGSDPKMSEFLRPETLFNRTKFDSYYSTRAMPVLDQQSNKPAQQTTRPEDDWRNSL